MFPGETVLSQGEAGRKNPHNGEFKVIRSQGSGLFYIGTMYLYCGSPACEECSDYPGPKREKGTELDYNSRETDYFDTEEKAKAALDEFKTTGVLEKERT